MASVFFMIFLAVVFFVAIFFAGAGAVGIVVWNVRKRRGKSPKKRWLVIPSIVLVISVIAALLPVSYIGFLRLANNSNMRPIEYAESGIMLVWPMGAHESTTAWFEMDGVKYVSLRTVFSSSPFFLSIDEDRFGEPVANIRDNPAATNAFNEFMIWLLSGGTTAEQSVSTIYPIMNDNGFDLYHVNVFVGINAYCAEGQLDSLKAYYFNLANYETRTVTSRHTVYVDGEGTGTRRDAPTLDIRREVSLAPGVFFDLHRMYDDEHGYERVEIPANYNEIADVAIPGTPIFGYDRRQIFAYSMDKMAYMHVNLALIGGRVYVYHVSGAGFIGGYPLSDEMNSYIINVVFVE